MKYSMLNRRQEAQVLYTSVGDWNYDAVTSEKVSWLQPTQKGA